MRYENLLVATNNEGKLKEYREMLSTLGIKIHSLKEYGIDIDVDENGKTYQENSYIKAKAISELVSIPVISDDSGIEILSLGEHFPGIFSARFAKNNGGYQKTFEIIKEKLRGKDRYAEFHCCICFLRENSAKPIYFEGICKGKILNEPIGNAGFGYDPIFECEENGLKFGIAKEEEKNHCSHRYLALKQFVEFLKEQK